MKTAAWPRTGLCQPPVVVDRTGQLIAALSPGEQRDVLVWMSAGQTPRSGSEHFEAALEYISRCRAAGFAG
jgi:hypothetical protein